MAAEAPYGGPADDRYSQYSAIIYEGSFVSPRAWGIRIESILEVRLSQCAAG